MSRRLMSRTRRGCTLLWYVLTIGSQRVVLTGLGTGRGGINSCSFLSRFFGRLSYGFAFGFCEHTNKKSGNAYHQLFPMYGWGELAGVYRVNHCDGEWEDHWDCLWPYFCVLQILDWCPTKWMALRCANTNATLGAW
jgi:hypothetical protein